MDLRARHTPSLTAVVLGVVLILLSGCARLPPAGGRVPVVASFYPLAEFARRIGGERVEVRVLVPPGVEPHDYEPSPRDRAALERARLLIYNGAGFEPWIDRLLPELPPAVERVNATDGIPLITVPDASAGPDPHVWLDPVRAALQADRILAGLVRVDPAGRVAYEANARTLRAALLVLHRRFEQGLGACRRKEFVTTHAAFGYLAARYGLRQTAVAGLDPEAEPSPARLRAVVEHIRRSGIAVVYSETLVGARTAEVLARETGARVAVLNPLEGLTPDEQRRGLDYFSVMHANLDALVDGLDCR